MNTLSKEYREMRAAEIKAELFAHGLLEAERASKAKLSDMRKQGFVEGQFGIQHEGLPTATMPAVVKCNPPGSSFCGNQSEVSLDAVFRAIERGSEVADKALAEIPAASLAAITAPLEARIAELEGSLARVAIELEVATSDLIDAEKRINKSQIVSQSLAAIQRAARAEERKACAALAITSLPGDIHTENEQDICVVIAEAILGRANDGEAKQ